MSNDQEYIEECEKLDECIQALMEAMNEDGDEDALRAAMEYFCCGTNKRAGMKHAIELEIADERKDWGRERAEFLRELLAKLNS